MQFDIDPVNFHRLPRHPDWAYELWDGHSAHLRHRPQALMFRRSTAWGPSNALPSGCRVEIATASGHGDELKRFLVEIWRQLDPYCSFEERDARLEVDLRDDLATSLFTAAYVGADGIVGAVVVAQHRPTKCPFLSWLCVARSARDNGVATSLLEKVCAEARARNATTLMSAVSSANAASLRWHLSRGFQLEPRRSFLSHG